MQTYVVPEKADNSMMPNVIISLEAGWKELAVLMAIFWRVGGAPRGPRGVTDEFTFAVYEGYMSQLKKEHARTLDDFKCDKLTMESETSPRGQIILTDDWPR